MSILNYITFDKPINKKYIEIGDGYIVNVDSKFKEKDNRMIINDDDYTSVMLNGVRVPCQYILGDVPYTPIFALYGEQVEPITGGNPQSYKDDIISSDGMSFKSTDGLCQGTFIVDPKTGERHINYGVASVPANVLRHAPSVINSASDFIGFENRRINASVEKLQNGWYKCTIYGMLIDVQFWGRNYSEWNMRGNMSMQTIYDESLLTVDGRCDINETDGVSKRGVATKSGRLVTYNNFNTSKANTPEQPYCGTYFLFKSKADVPNEYGITTAYIKDYALEKNYNFYRGSHNIITSGNMTGMSALKPINGKDKGFYLYLELWGIVEVYNTSPAFLTSSDLPNENNPLTINSQYNLARGLNAAFKNNEVNRVLVYCSPRPTDGYSIELTFVNGNKVITDQWLRNIKEFINISLLHQNFRQPSLQNVKCMMIFEKKENEWTDEYCINLTTNGLPNSRYVGKTNLLRIEKVEHYMDIGDTYEFKVDVLPNNIQDTITIYTSNRDIARVENGNRARVVTAFKEGVVLATAKSSNNPNITDTCVIKVVKDYNKICTKGLVTWIDAIDQANNNSPILIDRMHYQNLDIINLNYSESNPKMNSSNTALLFNGTRHVFTNLKDKLAVYTLEIRIKINKVMTPSYTDIISMNRHTNIEFSTADAGGTFMHDTVPPKYGISIPDGFITITLTENRYTMESSSYINGVLKNKATSDDKGDFLNVSEFYAMRHTSPLASNRYVNGEVASIRIYHRVLTEQEIMQNHNYENSINRG